MQDRFYQYMSDCGFRDFKSIFDKEKQELKLKIEQLSKGIENTEKKDVDITQ